jgi:uncharacterized protein with predicted RNA binding PUA domain
LSTRFLESNPLKRVRIIADFQFGSGAGKALFPDDVTFQYSVTKRVRYVMLAGERLVTLRAADGRLTLSPLAARRLMAALAPPAYRVSINPQVVEFVAAGKNAMARHVTGADERIRAGDEVIVVSDGDEFVAVGSAALSGDEMLAFNYGVAVQVRKGRES